MNPIFSCVIIFSLFFLACNSSQQSPVSKTIPFPTEKIDSPMIQEHVKSIEQSIDTNLIIIPHEAVKEGTDSLPKVLQKHLDNEYNAMQTYFGDLNRDQYTDLIILPISFYEDDVDIDEENQQAELEEAGRPLLLLIGQPDSTYQFVAENHSAILCFECGGVFGDPFSGITIKNGYFSVEHYGGSAWKWTRIITFKYNPHKQNWFLHRDGQESFHFAEPEDIEETIYTTQDFGVIAFEDFNIDDIPYK